MWNLGCSKMVIFMGNLTINPGVLWSLLCPLPLPFQFHRTLAVGAPTCENEIWRTSIVISRKRHWATTVTRTLHDKDWTVQQMDVAKAIVKKKGTFQGEQIHVPQWLARSSRWAIPRYGMFHASMAPKSDSDGLICSSGYQVACCQSWNPPELDRPNEPCAPWIVRYLRTQGFPRTKVASNCSHLESTKALTIQIIQSP